MLHDVGTCWGCLKSVKCLTQHQPTFHFVIGEACCNMLHSFAWFMPHFWTCACALLVIMEYSYQILLQYKVYTALPNMLWWFEHPWPMSRNICPWAMRCQHVVFICTELRQDQVLCTICSDFLYSYLWPTQLNMFCFHHPLSHERGSVSQSFRQEEEEKKGNWRVASQNIAVSSTTSPCDYKRFFKTFTWLTLMWLSMSL